MDAARGRTAATLWARRQAVIDRLAALGKELTEAENRVQELAQTITEQGYSPPARVTLPICS